ncbi:MAG: OmpA family protein [Bacteroidales bacterium]|jgi:outer membrane protein OmpA-like peptidoglycan-associated protein|nr:OmpA family protein [Bacteroidales bacterium]MDX9798635.1 OmpA family protein [Bacteroidales bacterium]
MENFPSKPQIHANTLVPKNLKYLLLFLLILFSFQPIFSQTNPKAEKEFKKALDFLNKSKDDKAIEYLNKALSIDPNYPDALLCMAEIYYNQSQDMDSTKLLAFPYYKKLVEISPDYDINAHTRLGEFYLFEYDTEKAENHLNYALSKYKSPKDNKKIELTQRKLKQLVYMQYALKHPVEFKPENMGRNINDEHDQYLPTLTADEQTFIFTSLIPDTIDFGLRIQMVEDFFETNKVEGKWEKAKKMPTPFNSLENEGALSISPDGRTAYFTRCNARDGFGSCDLYYSERIGRRWTEPKNMGGVVNSSGWDSQPTIASDGRTLFFVSNRYGGKGQNDIWYTYKQDNGRWRKPINLDSTINTPGNEMYPFIHPSNTTLYFSSDYHAGMGGMDIFYANIVNGRFTPPQNIGYPVNTSSDETSFIVSPSGKKAIFSAELKGGFGGKDLYEFDLHQSAQPTPVVYMKGKTFDKQTNKPLEVRFEVKNLNTSQLTASSVSDPQTGEYLVVLPLGVDYALSAWADGYLFYSENFQLADTNKTNSYQKDIFLTPIQEGESVVLNNIFFKTNSAELESSSISELNTLVELLSKNENISIEISGHTDNVGTATYNLELSTKRAQSVKAYLESKRIASYRLTAIGYGQTKPIAENASEEGRAKNRRTEFKIIKK